MTTSLSAADDGSRLALVVAGVLRLVRVAASMLEAAGDEGVVVELLGMVVVVVVVVVAAVVVVVPAVPGTAQAVAQAQHHSARTPLVAKRPTCLRCCPGWGCRGVFRKRPMGPVAHRLRDWRGCTTTWSGTIAPLINTGSLPTISRRCT